MANHLDDKDLVFQFKNGTNKELPFTQIIKKYQEKLYWHVRRMVVEHEDANDILQNMFVKVWKNLDNFREDSQLYTWLYRALSLSDDGSQLINKIHADKYFDANKLEWKLQLAIQKLPEKQRAVFNLRYYNEMPYQQMSKVLETSEGALKASYHHAVKKIEHFILNN